MNNLYLFLFSSFLFWQGSEKLSPRLLTDILTSKSPLAIVYSIRQYSINNTLILMAIKTLFVTNLPNYNVNETLMEKELYKLKKNTHQI